MGKEKGGKKDKRDVSELFELPQERKTVGTCHVFLTSFLDGETVVDVSSRCVEESGETENESAGTDHLTGGGTNPQSGKKHDDKKKGKGKRAKRVPTLLHFAVAPSLKAVQLRHSCCIFVYYYPQLASICRSEFAHIFTNSESTNTNFYKNLEYFTFIF